LQHTCGECRPNISAKMAAMRIHGVGGQGLRTPAADLVEKIYIVAITVLIGLMALHRAIDLQRHLRDGLAKRPQGMRTWTRTRDFVLCSLLPEPGWAGGVSHLVTGRAGDDRRLRHLGVRAWGFSQSCADRPPSPQVPTPRLGGGSGPAVHSR
jgi:hypothetical protein